MRIIKLFFPGQFEDAFVYMGRIIAITQERTLRVCNLEEVVTYLEEKFPSVTPLPTWMFLRNDWLAGAQFEALIRNKEIAQVIVSAFDQFPNPVVELSNAFFGGGEEDIKVSDNTLLDMTIYNQRLYLGASSGFYHVDIDFNNDGFNLRNKLTRRLDTKCMSTSVGYGAVNASCGEVGLFTALDDFGWLNKGKSSDMLRTADISLRTGWMRYNLVNYANAKTPTLLLNKRQKVSREAQEDRDSSVITELGVEKDLDYVFDFIRNKYRIDNDSIQFVYNSNNTIFIRTYEGYFYSIGFNPDQKGNKQILFSRSYEGAGSQILSAAPTKNGLIIEAYDRVFLFSQGEWFTITESEVLSVRTFMRSRRFQNLVAITLEDGILLAAAFDDSALLPRRMS